MTNDDFQQFYAFIMNDAAIQDRLKSEATDDAFFSTLIEVGKEKGFDFTAAEIRELAKAQTDVAAPGRDLSDAELSMVAGGSGCGCMGTWEGGKASNW